MIMYDQDPDVVRWGLNLLSGDPYPNNEYHENENENENATQNGTTYCDENYVREAHIERNHSMVENDEMLAHALQEEFSQLAVAEESGTSHANAEHSHACVLAQDWFDPSTQTYDSGNENFQEEVNDVAPSTSCSSPEDCHENRECSLELTDEFGELDGEVGKRLDQMTPVPHVPRINGEIPTIDEATSDHQRLLNRLRLYDLVELKVKGDGNCQFRALSDQFYRTTEHHRFVRQQVVNQLKLQPEMYEGYVPMGYAEYIKKMSIDGEWGDHVTLQAAADSYGVKIFVITSFKDTCYIEILPNIQKSKRVIFLSFWAEVHYNSIYPEGDFPVSDSKKKKRATLLDQVHQSCIAM